MVFKNKNACLEPILPSVNEDKPQRVVFENVNKNSLLKEYKGEYVLHLAGPNDKEKKDVIRKIVKQNDYPVIIEDVSQLISQLIFYDDSSIEDYEIKNTLVEEMEEIIHRYTTANLLIIEEVGKEDFHLKPTDAGIIVNILLSRFLSKLPTIITTTLGRDGLRSFLLEDILEIFKDSWQTYYFMKNKKIKRFLRYENQVGIQ